MALCLSISNALFGNFGGYYMFTWIFVFCSQNDYLLMLSSFFEDKNLWLSSQRRREEVVGVLMAALANIMGIVCLPLSCSKLGMFVCRTC